MRRQYLQIKKQYPDAILFFRLGDFYETFDDDAKIVSEVCEVALTSRPVSKGQRVPLAGVPWHSAETYIAKMVNAGYKVAICEQVGEVGKGLVDRDVVRVVTPGTLVEPGLLDERKNNYIAALVFEGGRRAGLAYADVTTGEFAVTEISGEDVARRVHEELARLAPAEVVIPDAGGYPGLDERYAISPYDHWRFETEAARQALLDFFEVNTLEGFGCEGLPLATSAAGALIAYLRETQKRVLGHLAPLHTYSIDSYMVLDPATRRNLELVETIRDGQRKGSLLWVLDKTRTAMGGRLLRRRISQPLLDVPSLNQRLDAVEAWVNAALDRAEMRELLRKIGDIERWTNRCTQKIALPRDLVGLRESLGTLPATKTGGNLGVFRQPLSRPPSNLIR
jgi:DNA mismatch repair protein MutS